jgi:hypothetical protein
MRIHQKTTLQYIYTKKKKKKTQIKEKSYNDFDRLGKFHERNRLIFIYFDCY